MKKVKAYIAMSVDGYIADRSGGVSFLSGDGSDVENFGSYPEFIETVDTVILGYSTYEQITTVLSPDNWPYKGKMSYVLTHRQMENHDEIIFTSEDVSTLIARLKGESGKDIWACGGASVINQLHQKGLIDEYILTIIPTILGGGIKMFAEAEAEAKLRLISTRSYNGIVDLTYEKRKK